ncbi:TetR/AcrR family transcriptional regulator [Microbulbifer sp. JTAC008]|uniref:TetR/AcrR family transcriptional regulator n=1 Tax=unclassified Microbulbifer TaxID=2619833 RepID=UPI00403A5D92
MSEKTNRRADNTRGRKRDSGRTEAILKAAATQLLEMGFDRFRIQDVADRAGSGTGAIYRRWPTKEALIAEAIRNMPADEALATDDPLADLRALVLPRYISALEKPGLVPGLVAAMRADEGIEQAVKDGFSIEHLRSTIARIIGEDHPHLDILTELSPAIALFRAAFTPETIEPERMVEEYISLVLTVSKSN